MSDFLDNTLYPALFERLDTALPEFNFRLKNAGGRRVWVSRTDTRPDGHQGGGSGKTFVSERSPFYLSDLNQGRGRSIWGYLKERDSLDNRGVFSLLCELAGERPKRDLTPDALERIEAARRRAELFEAVNAFLLNALHSDKSTGAEAARQHLKGRGLLLKELRQPEQELKDSYTGGERIEAGYFPDAAELRAYLEAGGQFTPEEIGRAIPIPKAAGRLSLTLRERGRIIGFKFRSIDGTEPKYLNLEGYKKEAHLPGLTRGQEVIFVEGELDQMTAHAAGFMQVVALGGSSISDKQIKAALNAGAKRLTLALDNDQPGKQATRKAMETLLRYLSENGTETPVFVCTYPDGIKDLEELLRAPGGNEAAQTMFNKRINAARYLAQWLDGTRAEEVARETGGGYDTDLFREELLQDVVHVERLLRPVDVPQFRQYIEPLYKTFGFDADAIRTKADQVAELEAGKRYRQEAADLAERAAALFKEGKQEEAEEALKGVQEARTQTHVGRFAKLLDGHNKAAVISGLTPPALKTRYLLKRGTLDPLSLELPAAAISVFAGASGHGKTTMLINLLLDLCELYPDKEFHFFSLEESGAAVIAKVLNCYLDIPFSGRNEPALEAYLKGDPQFIRGEYFSELREKEAQFWPLIGSRIFIHYLETGTAEDFCDAVKWLHRRRNIGAIFADYIQLFSLENRGRLDRVEELKHVCLMLKNTAIETGLPLCFGAQFNRTVKKEEDSHSYQNIGEAGDIERISALIVGLWNRTMINEKPKDGEESAGKTPSPYMAAKVLKWRGGPPEYYAVWSYDGNKKRIYPDNTGTTSAAAPAAANFSLTKRGK